MRQTLFEWCAQVGNDTLLRQWDTEKNGALTSHDVTYGSKQKPWWRCKKSHEWQAAVYTRTAGTGCPYCAGKRIWSSGNDLATWEPKVAAQWYQPLNGTLTPETVTGGSNKKVYWRCGEGHVWQAAISSRTGKQKSGCPVCAGQVKRAKLAYYDTIVPHRAWEAFTAMPEDKEEKEDP